MLEQDRVMAVKELAEKVGVSKRTVQREMEGSVIFRDMKSRLNQRPEKASGSKEHRKKRSACWKS